MYFETRRAAWMEVDLSALHHNYETLHSLAQDSVMVAAIKSDAYGHGAVKIAWELIKAGVKYLGVATIEEATALRSAGIPTPIILLGTTPRGNIKDIIDLKIIPTLTTFEDASLLSQMCERFSCGSPIEALIAVDTGMGRLGILPNDTGFETIRNINTLPGVKIKGIQSHLSASDEEDSSFTLRQIESFSRIIEKLHDIGIDAEINTIANSGGIIKYPNSHLSAVRSGISLYGIYPSVNMANEYRDSEENSIELKPVMSVHANIVLIRKVPSGFPVSYGHTYYTRRESLIGVLPLGYADGYPRLLSNRGRVIVNDKFAPIIGTVAMDQMMVDLTDVPNVKEYDEVTIMGGSGKLSVSAYEIAALSKTISYEVLTRFGQRLPKIYK